ncbi:alpha/beta hydrolase [Chlamydiia bacterium]|nr:alpha/beta hydrolase [Chlamydiia bacterium]
MLIRLIVLLCLPFVTLTENYVFELTNNKRIDNDTENYVDTYIIKNSQSDSLIVWFPGYYDYFKHKHIFTEIPFFNNVDILPMYFSSWNISKFQPYKEDNILDYFDSIDKILETIDKKKYKNIVLYGHSMGGLLATIYGYCGKYNHIFNGVILNDPYYQWDSLKFLSKNIYLHPLSWSWKTFYWSFDESNPLVWWYKSSTTQNLNKLEYLHEKIPNPSVHITAGHIWATTQSMNLVETTNYLLFDDVPTLLLMSGGIEHFEKALVLQKDLIEIGPKLSTNVEYVGINSAIHDVLFPQNTDEFKTLDRVLDSFFKTLKTEVKLNNNPQPELKRIDGAFLWVPTLITWIIVSSLIFGFYRFFILVILPLVVKIR